MRGEREVERVAVERGGRGGVGRGEEIWELGGLLRVLDFVRSCCGRV